MSSRAKVLARRSAELSPVSVCADCINLESALRLSGRGSYLGTGTSGVAAQSTPTSHNNSSGASATATSNKTTLCRSGRSYNSFLLFFLPFACTKLVSTELTNGKCSY